MLSEHIKMSAVDESSRELYNKMPLAKPFISLPLGKIFYNLNMTIKPYTEDEIKKFLRTIFKPNVPNLLKRIVQISDYDDMNFEDQLSFDDELESLEEMFQEPAVILGHMVPETNEQKIARYKEYEGVGWGSDEFQAEIERLEKGEPVIDLDRFLATKLSDKFLTSLVLDVWSSVEFHYDLIDDLWRTIFSSITITEEDRNVTELPDNFDVYRAGTKEGLSWTIDIEKGKWFHVRNKEVFEVEDKHNYFLKMNVNKDEVLFYTNDRGEKEVVLIPNQEKIIVL